MIGIKKSRFLDDPLLPQLFSRLDRSLNSSRMARRRKIEFCLLIFLTAFAFRAAAWFYWRTDAPKVQTTVATNYKVFARLLAQEGITGFFSRRSPMSNPDLLGHPPGYPLLLATIYKVLGESDTVVQFVQIIADAFAAVLIFLIVGELLNSTIALIAGLLSAASPQFAWNSILLLPDTLAVLPLLLALYCLLQARKDSRLFCFFLSGVLIGISCLLRPNSLLFAPLLFLLILIFGPWLKIRRAVPAALILLAGTVISVAPITIRNAVVFGRLVPLSIGAGQTLLEGIGDYDSERRFGFPDNDLELARMEADSYNRPDYAESLFGPDGIERDRRRLRSGANVIFANPSWFAGVMIQRGATMFRLERVPLISMAASKESGYPTALRLIQTFFITAVILPLAIVAIALLAYARRWFVLAAFLLIPIYYSCVQSALHTEYRYILALYHFLFSFVAVTLYLSTNVLLRRFP